MKKLIKNIRAFWIGFMVYPVAAIVVMIEMLFTRKK